MKKFFRTFILVFILFLLLGSILPSFISPTPVLALPNHFIKTQVAGGFVEPVDLVVLPESSGVTDEKILVIEKAGNIKLIKNGAVSNFTNAQIPVDSQGERGLLGITLDPNFATNHFIYIFYVNSNPLEYHLSRITESGDKMVPGSEVVLYKTNTNLSSKTHLGGGLRLGPDNKLWFTIGDNELNLAREPQKITSPYGKLHRVNLDGTIPSDNPFVGQAGADQSIWAYGLRNPWRFNFLPDGRPIIGDVGGDFWEEINVGSKGRNFGWPDCEGSCQHVGFVDPIYQYAHQGNAGASITGGLVYTGDQFPAEYKGTYFFGDYVNQFMKNIKLTNQGGLASVDDFDLQAGMVVSFAQGSDGSLYFLNIYPGAVQKLRYSTENQPPVAQISANPLFGDPPLEVNFSSNGSNDYEGAALAYNWDFGDGTTSTEANPKHTYTKAQKYAASLKVSDGTLESSPATIDITVGGVAPEIISMSPIEGAKYNAGDTIHFEANAQDREDGNLPASAFTWKVVFHHETHTHPGGDFNGVKSGDFKINDSVERSPDTYYEIILTVVDSSGLKIVQTRNVYPNKVNIVIDSNVPNMVVDLNGIPYATPYTTQAVVNFKLALEALEPVVRNGITYNFDSWSDGGAKMHVVTIPNTDANFTANYKSDSNPNHVAKNTVVAGDILINKKAFFDSDPETGLVVLFDEEADIETPFGASIINNPDADSAAHSYQAVIDETKTRGCGGSGCKTVLSFKWPSEQPQEKVIYLNPGDKVSLDKYSVIAGDIKINDKIYFDSDDKSGLVTYLEEGATVEAPWGATVVKNSTAEEGQKIFDEKARQMQNSGCGGGCSKVTTVAWPRDQIANEVLLLNPGEKVNLSKFAVISGDVFINGVKYFDDLAESGLVSMLEQDAEVETPYGATVIKNSDQSTAEKYLQVLGDKLKERGCQGGCSSVQIIKWPSQI